MIETAVLLLQAKNYAGSGNWLDESGNGHHATPVGSPTFDGTKFTLNGTTQWFTVADHANLDFVAGESFTVIARASVVDATPATTMMLIAKRAASGAGWNLYKTITTATYTFTVADAANAPVDVSQNASDGVAAYIIGRRDVGADNVEVGLNTMTGSPTVDNTTGTSANAEPLGIGFRPSDSGLAFNGSVFSVALWRSALTNQQIADAQVELSALGGGSRNRLLLGVG